MNRRELEVGLEPRRNVTATQVPFSNIGNIQLFFGGGDRARVLESCTRALNDDEAIVRVQGERGSGRTMLSMVLADRLADRYNVIRIDRGRLDAKILARQLAIELCPSLTVPAGGRAALASASLQHDARIAVRAQLARETPGDRPVLLVLDSPTTMDASGRELLEELCAVRRQERRMLQVAWFERISADKLRPRPAVTQRRCNGSNDAPGTAPCHLLRRLTLIEISDYLQHQMLLFDFGRRHTFTREMAYFVADRSEGVFRAVNSIARNAFTIAQLESLDRPTMSHLLLAGLPPRERPAPKAPFVKRHRRAVFALFASSVVASVAMLVLVAIR